MPIPRRHPGDRSDDAVRTGNVIVDPRMMPSTPPDVAAAINRMDDLAARLGRRFEDGGLVRGFSHV